MLLFHSQMRAGFRECLQITEGVGDDFYKVYGYACVYKADCIASSERASIP